jgi:hypothetical protein
VRNVFVTLLFFPDCLRNHCKCDALNFMGECAVKVEVLQASTGARSHMHTHHTHAHLYTRIVTYIPLTFNLTAIFLAHTQNASFGIPPHEPFSVRRIRQLLRASVSSTTLHATHETLSLSVCIHSTLSPSRRTHSPALATSDGDVE